MTGPLVSIVLNNYNYAGFLREAVDAALAQTHANIEVVVVDDGSTDGSRAILAEYGDRIRTVLKENGGQASAFNAGFAASRGDIICLLDSDDLACPERAERVVRAFRRNPRADWLRHQLKVVDADRHPLGPLLPDFRPAGPVAPVPQRFIEGQVRVLTSALAFRRDIGERVFPLPESVEVDGARVSLVRDADAYLTFRLGAVGGWYASVGEVLGEYRRHSGQQYLGLADFRRMMRRQTQLGRAIATAFDDVLPGDTTPTTVHKHRSILAALDGARLWSPARLGPALRGWRRAGWLLPVSPRLALRQSVGIAFALLAPRFWVRRVLRTQGFAPAPDRLGPGTGAVEPRP